MVGYPAHAFAETVLANLTESAVKADDEIKARIEKAIVDLLPTV